MIITIEELLLTTLYGEKIGGKVVFHTYNPNHPRLSTFLKERVTEEGLRKTLRDMILKGKIPQVIVLATVLEFGELIGEARAVLNQEKIKAFA